MGDKTSLYKQTFVGQLRYRMAVHQAKLVDELLILQDKKIHALFADYHENHKDIETLFKAIRALLNFKDPEESNLIKPIKLPSNPTSPDSFLQPPKEVATQAETPGFDKNKNRRMESIKDEINLSAIKVTPVEAEARAEEMPSFNQALLTFILRKEGISEKFVSKLVSCIDACERDEPDALENLTSELIDYGKSRLVNILKDDFTLKETSYILRHPDTFKEYFEKSNRLRADPRPYLRANLKDALKSVDELDYLPEEENEYLESPVISVDSGRRVEQQFKRGETQLQEVFAAQEEQRVLQLEATDSVH